MRKKRVVQDAGRDRGLIHSKIAYDIGDSQIVFYVQFAGFPPPAGVRLVGKLEGFSEGAGAISRWAVG
jgi:hypothetical protein